MITSNAGEDTEKLNHSYIAVWDVKCCSLSEKVQQWLRKLKWHLPFNQAIALLGINPRNRKIYDHTKACMLMFTSALLVIAKNWKQSKYPSTDETNWDTPTYHEILFGYKKKKSYWYMQQLGYLNGIMLRGKSQS